MTRIYLSPPHVRSDERNMLLEAFDSNWIAPLGPNVDAFEKELSSAVGASHACALSSGTAALHLSLVMLGVQAGDEVMLSSLTFAATANAVRYVGATPIFIDCDRETWTMDPELLAAALSDAKKRNKLPKAVIPVDLYGQSADYERLGKLCVEYGVPIVQDAAEALGAMHRGKPVGTQGLISVFSFNGNKIITTSGGGMLVSDRADLVERARFLATQARDSAPHYEHSTIGYNYRLSNLLAALGRAQLRRLPSFVEARRANYTAYEKALGSLPGWQFMPEAPYGRATRWLTCALVEPEAFGTDREAIRLLLGAKDIEARPVWKPMHMQPVFKDCQIYGGAVSNDLFTRGICLPSGSSLTQSEQALVIETVLAARRP
jgi:pyridoxal phosphate-dependent aminotransferase EpsN